MDEVKVWALSSYGGDDVTVCAPTALDALRLVQQRAAEGDAVAAKAVDPDQVALVVAAEIA